MIKIVRVAGLLSTNNGFVTSYFVQDGIMGHFFFCNFCDFLHEEATLALGVHACDY